MSGSGRPEISPRALICGAVLTLAVAIGLGRFAYTPILPSMMAGLGLSASDAGLIASANYVGYLLGAIVAAGGWGRGQERAILLASLAAIGVLSAAMAASDGLVMHVVLRFATGVASAFGFVFLPAIVLPRLAADGRPELSSFQFGGVGLGISASALLCGLIEALGGGWQAPWLWTGALALLAVPAVALALRGAGPGDGPRPLPEPPLRLNAPTLRIILAYGFFGFGFVVTSTFLIAIMRAGAQGYAAETAVWTVTGLSAFLSIWGWNRVARGIGLGPAFVAGALIQAAGIAASVLIPGLAGPLVSGVLLGGTFVGITALALRAAVIESEKSPRRVFAWMTASYGVGQIIGPFMAGYLADLTGDFLIASLIAAGFLLAAALIMPRR